MMIQVLRVITPGVTTVPFIELVPGEPLELVIGSRDGWVLRGPGIEPCHALLGFDGNTLHLASAYEDVPVLVEGEAIPREWTAVDPPCRIHIGPVELELAEESLHDQSIPVPPSQRRHAARVTARSGPYSTTPKEPRWQWPVVGLVLVAGIASTLVLHRGPRGPVVDRSHRVPAQSATVASAAPAPAPTPPPSTAPAVPALLNNVTVYPATHPPRTGSGKTIERLAADAFHAGDRQRAAKLYEDLAAKHPDNPAFAAAATILASMPN